MDTRAAVLLCLPLLTLAACGDDDDDNDTNVAVDRDAGVDGPVHTWPGNCDPVRSDCPAGQQCTGACDVAGVMAKAFACAIPAPGSTATHGQPCGNGCAPGHDCYTVSSPDGGTRSVCRKYCNTNADCPGVPCASEGLICTAGDPNPIGRVCGL
jgi:hypothetical protein